MKIGFRSPQWTANLRAERDLLRQLVPVHSAQLRQIHHKTPTQLVFESQNHAAYDLLTAPENSTLPDDYGLDDANTDLF